MINYWILENRPFRETHMDCHKSTGPLVPCKRNGRCAGWHQENPTSTSHLWPPPELCWDQRIVTFHMFYSSSIGKNAIHDLSWFQMGTGAQNQGQKNNRRTIDLWLIWKFYHSITCFFFHNLRPCLRLLTSSMCCHDPLLSEAVPGTGIQLQPQLGCPSGDVQEARRAP